MAALSPHNAYELVPSNGGHMMWGGDNILTDIKVYSFLWADRVVPGHLAQQTGGFCSPLLL